MERLEIQAIRVKSGNSDVQTKIAGNVIDRDEITIEQCVDMLEGHGVNSDRMREIAEAYNQTRRIEGSDQTWVVRDVSDFPESSNTRYCEITLMCGIVD